MSVLCACRVEFETCGQSSLTCAFSERAENRVRDLKSILLDMNVFCAFRIECDINS